MDSAMESAQHHAAGRGKARVHRSAEQAGTPSADTAAAQPSHEVIARRAYELFEERGGDNGGDVEDWLQAEQELLDLKREAGMLTREINEPARH